MKKLLLIVVLAAMACAGYSQRLVRNLNRSWEFTPGWEVRAGLSEPINVPHTWNLDALAAVPSYHRGLMNYFRRVEVPREWAGKRVYLRFKGANQTADVYINSKHVGQHKGGYTAFCFDVTPLVNFGASNSIWVRLTNAQDMDVMPLVGDFNMYGGIYRDVELLVMPAMHISPTDYASSGVYVTPTFVSQDKASLTVRTMVNGTAGTMGDVRVFVRNANGVAVDSVVSRVKIGASGTETVMTMFNISEPRLWNSTADPYMYRAEAVVYSIDKAKKVEKDSVGVSFGLRTVEVDANNQFLLNGKPFRIQGVTRHEDVALLGSAMYRGDHEQDVEMMRDMGVNAVRLTNYPQSEYFLDLCDRAGIMVWSEIPFTGPGLNRDKGYNDSEAFRENGEQQLVEMIRQQYNHPSIIVWGLFNELTQRGDDPLNYLRSLAETAKNEDPYRLTAAASNQDGAINFVTDLIGFNKTEGWMAGLPSDIGTWGAAVRKDFPKLKVALSDYGAGASIYQHQDSLLKPVAASYWHPEQWQSYLHEQYWRVISIKNYFWGTFAGAMFDFGSASRREGTRAGINDHGLVTFDRTVKKDAFYFYKANWNKRERFVYLASRRFVERSSAVQTFTVYSPCEMVQLIINGEPLAQIASDGQGTFVWRGCKLRRGENLIEARSIDGLTDSYTVIINAN